MFYKNRIFMIYEANYNEISFTSHCIDVDTYSAKVT